MPTTPPPTRPEPATVAGKTDDGSKAGATWVAGTGAFLLLAAAGVFIAVQWRSLPEVAKLAVVAGLTAGFIAGGRALRQTLPGTGDVLFHLGAFLVPVDVAGLCIRLDANWRTTLLAEGVVATGVLGGFALGTGSVVLGWAAGASVIALALGLAAVSPVAAPLLLTAAAVSAHLVGRRRLAIVWATTAGVAPVLGAGAAGLLAALAGRSLGAGTLAELGLVGAAAAVSAAVSGLACAAVLWREAGRSHDLALVALGAISVVSGVGVAWVASEPTAEMNLIAAPAVYVVVELLAMVTMRDAFWRRPARAVALGAEVLAGFAAPVAVALILAAPVVDTGFDFLTDAPPWAPDPTAGLAWALLASGWLIGGWRRQRPHPSPFAALRAAVADDRTVAFFVSSLMAGLVVGTASIPAIATGLVATALVLVATRGIVATALVTPAVAWAAAVVGFRHPAAVVPVGLVGAAVLTWAACSWRRRGEGFPTVFLTLAGAVLILTTSAFAAGEPRAGLGLPAALLVAVFAAWAMGVAVEGASAVGGHIARAPMAVAALAALAGSYSEAFPVALAATLLFIVEAVRSDDPWIGLGTVITAPLAIVAASASAGVEWPEVGVILAMAAVVLAGLASVTPPRWLLPVLATGGACLGAGFPLAAADPARLAEVVILTGGLLVTSGLSLRHGENRQATSIANAVAHFGGVVTTIGIGLHLVADGVTALEPFVAPVALHLLIVGWQVRMGGKDAPSSWISFGPAIVLLGGAGLIERLAGGAAWHALVAGGVGVVAVACGGWQRLAGPLFLGTGLVVTVTVLESLHTLAGVPTWAWLAAGGSALLAAGIGLERAASSPSEAGRRLVDVVSERFD